MSTTLATIKAGEEEIGSFAVTTSNGKSRGTRFAFVGEQSASALKTQCLAVDKTLKGAALKKAVNVLITGQKDIAELRAVAFLQTAFQKGFVATEGTLNKAENKASIVLVKAVNVEAEQKAAIAEKDEELAKLRAQLAALQPKEPATVETSASVTPVK